VHARLDGQGVVTEGQALQAGHEPPWVCRPEEHSHACKGRGPQLLTLDLQVEAYHAGSHELKKTSAQQTSASAAA
jgi:hypothetical protein